MTILIIIILFAYGLYMTINRFLRCKEYKRMEEARDEYKNTYQETREKFNVYKQFIENVSVEIQHKRRCGNSTRQIDKEIQYLFAVGEVVCYDHYGSIEATRHHIRVLLRRLEFEHHIPHSDLTYDQWKCKLTLKTWLK